MRRSKQTFSAPSGRKQATGAATRLARSAFRAQAGNSLYKGLSRPPAKPAAPTIVIKQITDVPQLFFTIIHN